MARLLVAGLLLWLVAGLLYWLFAAFLAPRYRIAVQAFLLGCELSPLTGTFLRGNFTTDVGPPAIRPLLPQIIQIDSWFAFLIHFQLLKNEET
jgi:hypothetical protein